MPYVTEQAAYHRGTRAETREAGEDAQVHLSRLTLPTIVCHASRATRMRPPFDLVACPVTRCFPSSNLDLG